MKMKEFRIQNYKKINDTGWIRVDNFNVFVGKNEAGKSALFKGLSKMKSSDGEKYDGLKEFPRRRFTDEYNKKDWPVSSIKFKLEVEDKNQLIEIDERFSVLNQVNCTRYYSMKLEVVYEEKVDILFSDKERLLLDLNPYVDLINSVKCPEGKEKILSTMKQSLLNIINSLISKVKENGIISNEEIDNLINNISSFNQEPWQQSNLNKIKTKADYTQDLIKNNNIIVKANKFIEESIPKLIYFDRYDILDSAIHFPTLLSQIKREPLAPKVRTTKCLFEYVGLDIERLASLGQHSPGQPLNPDIKRLIDERAIHFSSASANMTKRFSEWYEQRKHIFRYHADGEYFRIWVSDDLDPSEIELDQRSQGMQYFFSFYLVFLVESKNMHDNSILLLDEPGLHMHGTAQSKIVKFLERISTDNQTLYTTHSPFMVDANNLGYIRTVYENKDGFTEVSTDVWPKDKDTLFPLQAALGYNLLQSLFLSEKQLLVEGITDYWIIKAMDQVLSLKGKTPLRSDIILIPSAGTSKLLPLASMLIGHGIKIGALLDGDESGRKEGKKLINKLLSDDENKCLFLGDYHDSNINAELEDIFMESEYLYSVSNVYKIKKYDFNSDELKIISINDRLTKYFERKKIGQYEKWKVSNSLRDTIINNSELISTDTYRVFEKIFNDINKIFE